MFRQELSKILTPTFKIFSHLTDGYIPWRACGGTSLTKKKTKSKLGQTKERKHTPGLMGREGDTGTYTEM